MVSNSNRNRVDTRIHVLATVVGEFASAFGADQECLRSIRRGIFEKQIIEEIHLHYYARKKHVGHIVMKIDWEYHRVMVDGEDGNQFRIGPGKSIVRQLDEAADEIIKHTERIRQKCKVTRVETCYQYRRSIMENRSDYNEAMKFLGHAIAQTERSEESSTEFKLCVRFVIDKLKELEITVES